VTINNYNAGYSPFGVGAGSGALPIELSSFEVEKGEDEKVHLHWTTSSEINNSHFLVERSQDAKVFSEIGRVEGAGNSNALLNYYFVDENPYIGESYYRLKQVDYDGNYEYSSVISVSTDHEGDNSNNFIVFPNPSSGEQVFVKAYGGTPDEQVQIVVTDLQGKIISSQLVITGHHGEFVTGLDPNQTLSPGVYTVNEIDHDEIQSQRLIIHR
jgi:hypothetical protein